MHHLPPQQSITRAFGHLINHNNSTIPQRTREVWDHTVGRLHHKHSTNTHPPPHREITFQVSTQCKIFHTSVAFNELWVRQRELFFLFLIFFELSGDIRATDGLRGIWCVFYALIYATVTRAYHWRVISHSAQAAVWILAISQALWLAWLSAWFRANRDTGSRSHDMWGEEWWEMLMMRFCLKKKTQKNRMFNIFSQCGWMWTIVSHRTAARAVAAAQLSKWFDFCWRAIFSFDECAK